MSIVVTGANGQLGRLVIQSLLRTVPPAQIAALVRHRARAADIEALGVVVREGDYSKPATLAHAFHSGDKVLLVSSSEVGQRVAQHQAVIDAAREAGVAQIAYTSILHADTSPLALATEHVATEKALAASGLSWVSLRNGWYTENYTAGIPAALAHDALLGSSGEGKISTATRQDYADAAAAVLTGDFAAGSLLELAGDDAFTLSEFAAELSRVAGKPVPYVNLPEAEYKAVLVQAGLPEGFAGMIADSSAHAATGALFDDSRTLSRLIGRPTTPFAATVEATIAG